MGIETLIRQATLLGPGQAPSETHMRDIMELAKIERPDWQRRSGLILDPVASRQYFEEALEPITVADQTQITGTAEAAMWNMSGAAPPPSTTTVANQVRPGQIYRVFAHGVTTTPGASATTMTLTPRWGTTSAGTSFTASGVSNTAIISRTNDPWFLEALFTIRTVGSTGTAVAAARFTCPAIGTAAANPGSLVAGSTASVTIDTTVASGFYLGATLAGSASWTLKTIGVVLEALN